MSERLEEIRQRREEVATIHEDTTLARWYIADTRWLLDRLSAVEALHTEVRAPVAGGTWVGVPEGSVVVGAASCSLCRGYKYPCDTIRALRGES